MKRILYFVLCIFTCMTLLTACGDSDKPVDETTQAESDANINNQEYDDENIDNNHNNDVAEEVPVVDAVPPADSEDNTSNEVDIDDPDENGDEELTSAQENVADNPTEEFHASGTFNGFVDSSSVEITMSDGSYQTFFVYEEAAVNRLQQLAENETPPTIQFVYKAREGQINPEIISVN